MMSALRRIAMLGVSLAAIAIAGGAGVRPI